MDTLWQQSFVPSSESFLYIPARCYQIFLNMDPAGSFFVESTHEEITIDAADTPWSAFFRHLRYRQQGVQSRNTYYFFPQLS